MIIETPSPEEFTRASLDLLNLAWEIGVDLLRDLEDAQVAEWDDNGEVADEYWKKSQPALGNAFALIQQAQEMSLKGKVAKISPLFIIAGDIRDWPKQFDKQDIPFAAFKTRDAQDLFRLHNAVCVPRLSDAFGSFYNETRRRRNMIIHQVSKSNRMRVDEVLISVVQTQKYLHTTLPWPKCRKGYIDEGRLSVAFTADHAGAQLLNEFDLVARFFKPAELKHLFGFDKKARRYICPTCKYNCHDWLELIGLAQLRPLNQPTSDLIYCFVCESETPVLRQACDHRGCKSNVIYIEADSPQTKVCLVCDSEQTQQPKSSG